MDAGLDGAGAALVALVAVLWVGLLAAVAWAWRPGAGAAGGRGKALVWTGVATAAWLAATAALAASGRLRDYDAFPPPMFRVVLPGVLLVFAAAFSGFGKRLVDGLGWGALIGYQAFRIPVELLLSALYQSGRLPVQMTFHGANYDVLTGIFAALLGLLAARKRAGPLGILVWNIAGLALLANIVTIAVLSMPGRLRLFPGEPANTIVFGWPFIWLPAWLVMGALFGHLLVFRKLWRERAQG
jgi:hypothetical protein